jgi:hypothetical protein
MTPTQRTLAYLRGLGATAAVVERWNAYAHVRQDLFGFIDILALFPPGGLLACAAPSQLPVLFPPGIYGVQCTSGANHAAHAVKIAQSPYLHPWLDSGGRVLLISWSKTGPRGRRKTWTPRLDFDSFLGGARIVNVERIEDGRPQPGRAILGVGAGKDPA